MNSTYFKNFIWNVTQWIRIIRLSFDFTLTWKKCGNNQPQYKAAGVTYRMWDGRWRLQVGLWEGWYCVYWHPANFGSPVWLHCQMELLGLWFWQRNCLHRANTFYSKGNYEQETHLGQCCLQFLAQGHLSVWTGEFGDRTSYLFIEGWLRYLLSYCCNVYHVCHLDMEKQQVIGINHKVLMKFIAGQTESSQGSYAK